MIALAGKSCADLFVIEQWIEGWDDWRSLGKELDVGRALYVFGDAAEARAFRREAFGDAIGFRVRPLNGAEVAKVLIRNRFHRNVTHVLLGGKVVERIEALISEYVRF